MNTHNPTAKYISALSWADPARAILFENWLEQVAPAFSLIPSSIQPASADASFRRYFRIASNAPEAPSYIIMDAPAQQEDSQPFVTVAQLMHNAHIRAPQVLQWDEQQGFMLITDLGKQTVLEAVHANPDPALAHQLFKEATEVLVRWQLATQPHVLPEFGEKALRRDLNLFPDWYIAQHRQFQLTDDQKNTLEDSFKKIIQRSLATPNVYVHRDYMPRNLMVGTPLADGSTPELGVIDFQDAVYGPISYDIASLTRDAFHSWDEEFVLDITVRYWEAARKAGLPVGDDFSDFWIAAEWMGLQRHLKILGIFARLTLRDGKPKYLADTPRFIHYVRATCDRYVELRPLLRLIDEIERINPQYGYSYGR